MNLSLPIRVLCIQIIQIEWKFVPTKIYMQMAINYIVLYILIFLLFGWIYENENEEVEDKLRAKSDLLT